MQSPISAELATITRREAAIMATLNDLGRQCLTADDREYQRMSDLMNSLEAQAIDLHNRKRQITRRGAAMSAPVAVPA